MSPLRYVAPAGTPLDARTFGAWAVGLARRTTAVDELSRAICVRQSVRSCFPVSTGRAGLVLILRALARLSPPHRRRVVIPSYTCYTVPASVVIAGLSPLAVDIDPATLDFDRAALDRTPFDDVLAIVPTSLFGLPSDLPYLSALARAHGVRLVDDAAQALGASTAGRPSGSWGDAGLYSLDKGKNITTIDGGLIVTAAADVAAALTAETARLPERTGAAVGQDVVKMVVYGMLLRPWLYWIPNGIPQLELGTTRYPTEIAVERYPAALAAMALVMLERLDRVNEARRALASTLEGALAGTAGFTPVRSHAETKPVYLRYPLLADTAALRDEAIRALTARGIGATGSYPNAIVDVPELSSYMTAARESCANGRAVASRLITLPTHAYVSPADIATISEVLHGLRREPTRRTGPP